MIEMKEIYYSYGKIAALEHIDLSISKGESVALMGANGCGKSTLLKILNGIISPDRGSYCFEGEEITHKKLQDVVFSKRLHQKIAFVFQNSDAQLFCSNVYDEIAFGPRQMGFSESDVQKRVNDCLDLLKIQDFKDRVPYHLSGGEKRKVAIACVLSSNPDVLILDEPMNGLDPKTQRWLVEFLTQLNHGGKTILVSTHNLELVEELSTRAILFGEDHRIAGDMPTKQLLENISLLKQVNLVDDRFGSE